MNDVFKRDIQQFQAPRFGGVVRYRVAILPDFEYIIEEIGADEAAGTENKNWPF
ncbi:hypothetical protein D3C86_1997340 [compost metagenome]